MFRRFWKFRVRFLRVSYRATLALIPAAAFVLLFWPARTMRSDNFIFYFPSASHVVPFQSIGQTNYLPLFQVLNLVGKVKGLTAAHDSVKVWFEDTELEFKDKDKTIRVKKAKVKMADPMRLENGEWLVPACFLETVLPQLIRKPVIHRVGSRRVFIGDVKLISFTARLEPVANGARLVLQFSDKVNIRTVSSNGKWVVFLGDKPVQPLEQRVNFQDPYVANIQFDDQDGVPKLIVTPTVDGLNFFPKVEESGKTLQAEVVKPAPAVAELPAAPPQASAISPVPSTNPPAPGASQPATAPAVPSGPSIVLDAGHGGDDTGARGGNGILEKDLTAQLVARIRSALLAQKKYRIVLTRLGDVNPSLDQRDATANQSHPQLFLTFHGGNLGVRAPRVVVFSYQPGSLYLPPQEKAARGAFIPWDTVQLYQLSESQRLAQVLQSELAKISGLEVDPPAAAPVRVLRSVNAPAVAVEVGSLASDVDSSALTSLNFQEELSNAVVRAIDIFQGGRS